MRNCFGCMINRDFGREIMTVRNAKRLLRSYFPQTAPKVAFVLLKNLIGKERTQAVKNAIGF